MCKIKMVKGYHMIIHETNNQSIPIFMKSIIEVVKIMNKHDFTMINYNTYVNIKGKNLITVKIKEYYLDKNNSIYWYEFDPRRWYPGLIK